MFTMDQARARFEERFRELQNKARAYFRDYTPEARDEAVSNSLYLTWHNFMPLVECGKADDALLTSTFYYSCRATRSGRVMRAVKHSKFRELWSHMERDMRGLDLDSFVHERNSVPDIVSFRLDTPAWLDSLTPAQRERALVLGQGTDTKEVARMFNVSAPAVSQWRKTLEASYRQFMSVE
jgi:hypothetical protein